MKTVPKYYAGNDETVEAYQPADIKRLENVLFKAQLAWYDSWITLGSSDHGSCCVGKGIRVWFVGPRKRSADLKIIVWSPPCQGNLAASESVGPALELLKSHGIDAEYYDGRID